MAIDFQEVRQQAKELAERAPARIAELARLKISAQGLLAKASLAPAELQEKVARAAVLNPNLICAVPAGERISAAFPLPDPPDRATIIAADGSQIYLDRHSALEYALINIGAIWMERGSSASPRWEIQSKLLYDEQLYTENGRITERLVSLLRDLEERTVLTRLAASLEPPIVTITDGPLELWGAREGSGIERQIERVFEKYLDALKQLCALGVSTAGYVDKPASDLVVRLLEIYDLDEKELRSAGRSHRPLLGVIDAALFGELLAPCERSAIFRIQSVTAAKYTEELALHFFYLHLGHSASGQPFIARVEIPAWVADNEQMISDLHALLVEQSQILGTRRYPYLLHRSHETALVTRDDKEQVDTMIAQELQRMQVNPGEGSSKAALKTVPGRSRRG